MTSVIPTGLGLVISDAPRSNPNIGHVTESSPIKRNLAIAEEQYQSGRLVLESLPVSVTVETTSICNLRCVMCPHAIGNVYRPKHLPNPIMHRLTVAMSRARDVQLHGIGEPLLSPAFWWALEKGRFNPDTQVSFNTNFTLLHERWLQSLLHTPLRLLINISLDAATERTYRRIRGADFGTTLRNISRLRDARGNRQLPIIFINMTLMRENIEEIVSFVELAHGLGVDGVDLWHLNRWPDRMMKRYRLERDDWHFDYANQGLWNYKSLSNRLVREALRRGQELGIPIRLDQLQITLQSISQGGATARSRAGDPNSTRSQQRGAI
jgi:MoaA/NifB/PqqE/SkfB family radical SAM enzyme